jgi:diaminopimelate epimerase
LHGRPARIETGGGQIELMPGDGQASVDMGTPRFGWKTIPLAYAMDTSALPLGWGELENPMAVNVGNPHVVFFVDDVDGVDLAKLGPEIERDAVFPQGINVNVVQVLGRDRMRLRVWERGAGLTRACGTGACASAVAAIRKGFVDNIVTVGLPGGDLSIEWPGSPTGECARITMTGPAAESFRGTFLWEDFA